jgi:polar amino acid transport system ATP-binding protein
MTVVENLMLGQTEILGRTREEACRRGMELLNMVGLTDKALEFPNNLSGGQQQRVAIIRALSMDPKIMLFDEPTSALDPAMTGEVLAVIRKLARSGMTMLIVTHEMRFARDVSTRIFFMNDGIIYEEGTPQQIFGAPTREKTRQFINSLLVFETKMTKHNTDMLSLMTQIEEFGYHHMIARGLINGMLTVAEELCINMILPDLGDDDELRLVFEYSESLGTIRMETSFRTDDDDEAPEDSISLTLIKHVCPDITYKKDNGLGVIKGTITKK